MMRGAAINYGAPVNRAHPLAADFASWWLPLPNWSGGLTLFDLCGRANGVLTNGAAWGAGGSGFGAVVLDGSDDYVLTSNLTADPVTRGFSFEAAIRPAFASSDTSRRGVVSWTSGAIGAADQPRIRLIWGEGGLARFVIDSKNAFSYWCAPSFAAGESHTIGFTRTAQSVGNQFYWDGQPIATTSAVDVAATFDASGFPVYLGLDAENAAWAWSGAILSASVHARARTASEFAAFYDQWLRGFPDTLNRFRRRVWDVPAAAGGGGSTVPVKQHNYRRRRVA